jgi:glycosyltransferase involved in cell wall biosynthesis
VKVLAYIKGYPPKARVGAWISMHTYMAALVEAGHEVTVLIPDRVPAYELDGVTVMHIGNHLWSRFQRSDVCISIHGDEGYLHRVALENGRPSVRFIHGTHDTLFHKLGKIGPPTLLVINSHSLAETVIERGYQGEYIVCHPWVDPRRFETEPGDHITLVNLIKPKGLDTFDQIARYLPKRPFLGVKGGYGGPQDDVIARPNITVIPATKNVRDDILARTRILLMPSDHETWGLIGVEALCAGIPVIAHPTLGLQESLGDAGLFADRDDIDAWLDIIEDLDSPKRYKAQSAKCKARADLLAKDDSRARFVKRMEELA